jgi:hypothetical protein
MAASLLIREGANVKAVQRSLGHKSAMMTLDRSAARRWSICAKEQVSDLLLLVEVGRLELPSRNVVPGLLRAQPPVQVRTRAVRWRRSQVLASEGVPAAVAGIPPRVSLLSTPDPLPQAKSGGRLPKSS